MWRPPRANVGYIVCGIRLKKNGPHVESVEARGDFTLAPSEDKRFFGSDRGLLDC